MAKRETKFKVILLAYKEVDDRVKNIITRYSVCNIKNMESFKELLRDQTNYQGSGRDFNLNDRVVIYLGWFKASIEEKLGEGYILDIIEVHKSYGNTREELLKSLDIAYGDDILIVDMEEI
ncbi:MAG: hypothetical protein GX968_05195 [Tissierellia bacterium]|nr:hypothetical protein [Tissierellia bacterium]